MEVKTFIQIFVISWAGGVKKETTKREKKDTYMMGMVTWACRHACAWLADMD